MPIEITVRGGHHVSEPPELVTVHASIHFQGPALQPVYERVARDLDDVTASLEELATDNGPVTAWSTDRLRTSSHRPWRDDVQLDPVHGARVSIQATFRQFDLASRWIADRIAASDGFDVGHLGWALTRRRHEQLMRDVRKEAARDAAVRAQDYADALELGPVTPTAIADPGMLQSGSTSHRDADMMLAGEPGGSPGASDGPSVDLTPENIEISATVEARFAVGM